MDCVLSQSVMVVIVWTPVIVDATVLGIVAVVVVAPPVPAVARMPIRPAHLAAVHSSAVDYVSRWYKSLRNMHGCK